MNRSVAWLHIRLGPSRRLAALLLVAHLAAALGVLASPLPWIVRTPLLLMLGVSLAWNLRRHAWVATRRAVVRLDLSDTLEFEAEERSGTRFTGIVQGTTFVAPWLIVMNLEVDGHRFPRAVVIVPDATDRESFRAARVWLRWRPAAARAR